MSAVPPPPPPPPTPAADWPVANPTKIRKRLLWRIARGEVCGTISQVSGRPCLATPLYPGGPCQMHGKGHNGKPPRTESKPGKMLRALMSDALSPEESRIFEQVFSESTTLETEIATARLKLVKLERDHADGKLRDRDYQRRWTSQMDALRKLVLANQKARLAEETLRQLRDDPSTLPDVYDPLGDADGDSEESEGRPRSGSEDADE